MGCSVVWKPVATMMASTSRVVPSAVTMPVGVISRDPVGDEVDVGAVERGVVGVRDQDALAADLEVRGDRGPQGGVGDAALRCSWQASFFAGAASFGLTVNPGTKHSRPQ